MLALSFALLTSSTSTSHGLRLLLVFPPVGAGSASVDELGRMPFRVFSIDKDAPQKQNALPPTHEQLSNLNLKHWQLALVWIAAN